MNLKIYKNNTTVTLRSIRKNRYTINKFAIIKFLFKGNIPEGKEVFIKFNRKVYIVNNLKANILLSINILGPEKVIIDIPN